ncbi:MAG: zinc-dependent peptidase [Burkholderiales bacterium]|nr:zinc-dependent peptidase [Burkholderiales bacterium]MBH2015963.1 zinc-dependent peptidase [Burkholderiales bacterium]
MPLVVVTCLAALLIAWFIWQPRWEARRRQRQRSTPFPPAWRAIIRRRVPLAARLPADLQMQLRRHIQVFLAQTPILGCQGQEVDDEVRVTIAAQACLLLLNRADAHFAGLRQVLVYPSAFLAPVEHRDEAGVVQSGRDWRAGESWQEGQVVLSWADVLEGAARPHDGWNVVIHEFAHQLDARAGISEGMGEGMGESARWHRVMQPAFEGLQAEVDAGEEPFLDPYGATDAVEFFAVVTEAFFEQGAELAEVHPALFAEFLDLYGVDTRSW